MLYSYIFKRPRISRRISHWSWRFFSAQRHSGAILQKLTERRNFSVRWSPWFSPPRHVVIKFIFVRVAGTNRWQTTDVFANKTRFRCGISLPCDGHYRLARSRVALRPHKITEIRITSVPLASVISRWKLFFFSFFNGKCAMCVKYT